MRWDGESPVRFVVSLAGLAVGAYFFATTEPTYYLHLPNVVLMVLAVWSLLLAVVPLLRAGPGTPHRALILAASYAVILLVIVIAGMAAVRA